jgi:phytanoyl-CoA hydroxylase
MDVFDDSPWRYQDALPLPARKGTLIVLDGLLPHFSSPNRSPVSRHAYTLHLIDAACRYAPDNWLQRAPAMLLRGF